MLGLPDPLLTVILSLYFKLAQLCHHPIAFSYFVASITYILRMLRNYQEDPMAADYLKKGFR